MLIVLTTPAAAKSRLFGAGCWIITGAAMTATTATATAATTTTTAAEVNLSWNSTEGNAEGGVLQRRSLHDADDDAAAFNASSTMTPTAAPDVGMSRGTAIATCVIIGTIIVATIVGNLLVCVAIATDRTLKQVALWDKTRSF